MEIQRFPGVNHAGKFQYDIQRDRVKSGMIRPSPHSQNLSNPRLFFPYIHTPRPRLLVFFLLRNSRIRFPSFFLFSISSFFHTSRVYALKRWKLLRKKSKNGEELFIPRGEMIDSDIRFIEFN